MRHRTEKYKQKATRKSPNKERIIDTRGNLLDYNNIKEKQNKSNDKPDKTMILK